MAAASLAAELVRAGTPLAKKHLADVGPWLLAALLHPGSGFGLAALRLFRQAPSARLEPDEWPRLIGAVVRL